MRLFAAAGGLALLLAAACDRPGEAVAEPLPPEGLEEGMLAPPLEGREGGSVWSLERDRGPQVLVFYRGYDCGLCRRRLEALQGSLAAYRDEGVRVVALTPDDEAGVEAARDRLGLDMPVVQLDSAALEGWGVLDGHGTPQPATVLLDERGVIQFRHRGRNAADRASDIDVLAALHQHRRRR
jgi:peroxiredoxin